MWDGNEVPLRANDHMLFYTDGVCDVLAGEDGSAQPSLERAISRTRSGVRR